MDLLIHNRQSNVLPLSPPPPPSPSADDLVESRISPSILLIIVILAVIFFVSGILHLLVRYLLKPPTYRDADDIDIDATALQGQLQQLFHLHDSGVDQSFIDMLPVFPYKAIIGGVKDPFDCAVCLCEFEPDNRLRLLPKCSHAFHMDCIDTWLLAHSTCPLCRSTLLPADYSPTRCCSPILVLIESAEGDRASTEMDTVDPHIGHQDNEIGMKEETEHAAEQTESSETKVVQVKLGKFRSVEGSSNVDSGDSSLDQRRCFSMGTYEYVMNENSLLQVAIKPSKKRRQNGVKRHRLAMSECDCHSKRESFKGFGEECGGGSNAKISSSGKRESFSISKTWLRSKKEKPGGTIDADCSRRAFSFRLPALHSESKAKSAVIDADCSRRAFSFRLPALHSESKVKSAVSPRTTVSEFDMDTDVEVGSCNNSIVSMGSQIEKTPSFARRTLLWIVGRQNRVGSSMS